ncbi:hypothetical protein DFP72DRAFT_869503 [Ephemerocybe angulata]|uniref:Uncharacterized protein n=1 Tax=Ephemerocybe angulata TaxID=980116 RepID=A0A8H6MDU0_9AGAR|nr:hypothetical protein DFP72DRAFT_869503 [Tulosesus angulatus]
MTSTYTPSNAVDQEKEKEWPAALGMLDWDDTSIVFTKRSLIEFLKYTGTTVDTNFGNIAKLPRYAKFGKLSEPTEASAASATESAQEGNTTASYESISTGGFKPTRRVREPPGGSHSNIFQAGDEDDALSQAPARPGIQHNEPARAQVPTAKDDEEEEPSGIPFTSTVIPSRRVREIPGGKDSLASLWGEPTEEEFKPTRRVREGPGGRDNISGIF